MPISDRMVRPGKILSRRYAAKGVTFVLTLALAGALPAFARVFDCGEYYEEVAYLTDLQEVLERLPPHSEHFVRDVFLPLVGRRLLQSTPGVSRGVQLAEHGDGITFSGFGGKSGDVHIRFVDRIRKPYFRIERNGNRTIFIPKDFDFAQTPTLGQSFFYRALRGHSLNPFVKSDLARQERAAHSEKDLIQKEVQREAIRAAQGALQRGDGKFLFVGPTGVGKTLVLEGVLDYFINKTARALHEANEGELPPNVHIVFADKDFLVDQLYGDIKKMNFGTPFQLVRWGGKPDKSIKKAARPPDTLEGLIAKARESGEPTILVTTVQTLIPRSGKTKDAETEVVTYDPEKIRLLQNNVGSFTIDEAHHSGAKETAALLDAVLGITRDDQGGVATRTKTPGHTPPQIVGLTATPTRTDMKFIEQMFEGNAFWGYLDKAEEFLTHGPKSDRTTKEILDQLKRAIDLGESHPFRTYFLDPKKFEKGGPPLFVTTKPGRGATYELNRAHEENFYQAVSPFLKRHQHLFFSCASKTDAEHLAELFTGKEPVGPDGKPHTIAFLHSGLPPDVQKSIKEDFKAGKISMLFNVGIMDEGIDIPSLTCYIDVNRQTSVKDLVQRIGRVLRLHEGKTQISEVVTFQQVDDLETAKALLQFDNMSHRRWGPKERDDEEEEEKEGEDKGYEEGEDEPFLTIPHVGTATPVTFSRDELKELRDKFFKAKYAPTAGTQNDFTRISDYIRELAGADLDPFQPMPPKARKVYDLLTHYLDDEGKDGISFSLLLQEADPLIRGPLETYIRQRQQLLGKRQDPVINANWMLGYVNSRRLPPQTGNSQDEKLMVTASYTLHSDPVFFTTLTGRKDPTAFNALDRAFGLSEKMKALTASPEVTMESLARFAAYFKRDPQPEARGFEGTLARAVAALTDPKAMSRKDFEDLVASHTHGDEDLIFRLLGQRSARDTAPPVAQNGGSSDAGARRKVRVPGDFPLRGANRRTLAMVRLRKQLTADKNAKNRAFDGHRTLLAQLKAVDDLEARIAAARTEGHQEEMRRLEDEKEERLTELSNHSAVARLAGVLPASRVSLKLKSTREDSVSELAGFYETIGGQLGLKVTVSGTGTSRTVVFESNRMSAVTPGELLAFEQGTHNVQYVQGGTHQNPVTVTSSLGAAPGTPAGVVRRYSFKEQKVVDDPGAEKRSISMGKAATGFQEAIYQRLLLLAP